MPSENKHPSIRRGQRTPYIKGTRLQIAERIQYAFRLVARDNTKGQIHSAMKAKFGVGWRQCERYMARVRPPTREKASRV
jgi:hypothetical protein